MYDIFSVPIYKTETARLNELKEVVKSICDLDLWCPIVEFYKVTDLVCRGFLSARSASYLLTGRVTPHQANYFFKFLAFYESFELSELDFKIKELWQKTEKEVENTLLFPLAELASNDFLSIDFSDEK